MADDNNASKDRRIAELEDDLASVQAEVSGGYPSGSCAIAAVDCRWQPVKFCIMSS